MRNVRQSARCNDQTDTRDKNQIGAQVNSRDDVRGDVRNNTEAAAPNRAPRRGFGERVRAWWRELPLMRAFACYTAACIAVAGVISFGVMASCLEAYSYLDRIEGADRVEVDSGPYVYDEATSELVPAVSIDLANGFGDRILFLGLRGGAGRASVEGGVEVIRADNERKVVYATVDLLESDPELEILDWGGNYTEADAREAGGNPYDPEPIDPADLAAYDERERADRVPVTDSRDGALGRLGTVDEGMLVSNVGYYVKQAAVGAESLPMLALRVAAGFAPFVVLGVVAVIAFRRFYRMRLAEPLGALRAAADRVAAQDLDFRVGAVRGREFGRLAEAFERMRASLERTQRELWEAAEARRRLNAAFAHDLRTPVTVLKGTLEMMQARLGAGEADASAAAAGDGGSVASTTASGAGGGGAAAPQEPASDLERDVRTLSAHVERLGAYAEAMTGLTKLEDRPLHALPTPARRAADEIVAAAQAMAEGAGLAFDAVVCMLDAVLGALPESDLSDSAAGANAEVSTPAEGAFGGAARVRGAGGRSVQAPVPDAGAGSVRGVAIALDLPLVHEVAGNLVANACRYARSTVHLTVLLRAAVHDDAAATDPDVGAAGDVIPASWRGEGPDGDGVAGPASAKTGSVPGAVPGAGDAPTPLVLEVVVADDGPGFTPEALRRGCEAFFSEAKSAEHFGLGLAIAQTLARLHGGGVSLANASWGGARVTALFAVKPAPDAAGVPCGTDAADTRDHPPGTAKS